MAARRTACAQGVMARPRIIPPSTTLYGADECRHSSGLWEEVFTAAGTTLETQASGCCGMSGTYRHEARNRETSEKIFQQSWARHVDGALCGANSQVELLATGYSCRCQVKRLRGAWLCHPVEAVVGAYRTIAADGQ